MTESKCIVWYCTIHHTNHWTRAWIPCRCMYTKKWYWLTRMLKVHEYLTSEIGDLVDGKFISPSKYANKTYNQAYMSPKAVTYLELNNGFGVRTIVKTTDNVIVYNEN